MVQESTYSVNVKEIEKPDLSGMVSVIGHQDTSNVLGVEMNRVSITLKRGDKMVVCQLIGGRLPEGSTTLPEGFEFKFFEVEIV